MLIALSNMLSFTKTETEPNEIDTRAEKTRKNRDILIRILINLRGGVRAGARCVIFWFT